MKEFLERDIIFILAMFLLFAVVTCLNYLKYRICKKQTEDARQFYKEAFKLHDAISDIQQQKEKTGNE